jgi:hypothetical protein
LEVCHSVARGFVPFTSLRIVKPGSEVVDVDKATDLAQRLEEPKKKRLH